MPRRGQDTPPPIPLAAPSASQAPAPQTVYTISFLPAPAATLIPDGGTRAGIEGLPGQNQNKPNLDGAKIEAETLPGVNQDTSNMGEPLNPGVQVNPKQPSAAPEITVNRPLPGQNQANPIMGEPAPLPVPSPLPPPLTVVQSPAPQPSSSRAPTPSSVLSTNTSTAPSDSRKSTQTSSAVLSSTATPLSVATFVTITRSNQGKEQAPVTTLSLTSAFPTPIISASVIPMDTATPQAIAVVQSISGMLSSATMVATATLTPAVLSSDQQDGGILHPTARILLIVFVILGALSILIAIVVCMMVRSHKRHSRAQKQAVISQNPYDASSDRIGVTTHISANSNDNPFLTTSEKAIIDRAASPNGTPDMNYSSSISDAITSFINKSRRLTYKISP
ncbi:hypothetical protein M3J09_011418 [Ascochyta lentis]